jgi:hypothetical protein
MASLTGGVLIVACPALGIGYSHGGRGRNRRGAHAGVLIKNAERLEIRKSEPAGVDDRHAHRRQTDPGHNQARQKTKSCLVASLEREANILSPQQSCSQSTQLKLSGREILNINRAMV